MRPIVFDHELAKGRDDVVLAHLNHRLVQMAMRLLRAEVWSGEAPKKLHRVTARVIPDHVASSPLVIVYGRLVVIAGDSFRLHEELIAAGGEISQGRFRRFNVGQVQGAIEAMTSREVSARMQDELAELWPSIEGSVQAALAARAKERTEGLQQPRAGGAGAHHSRRAGRGRTTSPAATAPVPLRPQPVWRSAATRRPSGWTARRRAGFYSAWCTMGARRSWGRSGGRGTCGGGNTLSLANRDEAHMTASPHNLITRMADQIARWEQSGDRRAVFLACYRLMTTNMLRGVAEGRFRDGPWVDALIENFAGYYFAALDAYEQGEGPLPVVWRRAHDLTRQPTTTVIQSLLMGVNAHINCDLVLVLDDMLSPVWAGLDPARRDARYHDYCLVNSVIAETIDAVQDQVIEPYARAMDLVDRLCGPLDEWCTGRLLRNWRADVWRRALAIVEADSPAARRELRSATDTIALRRIELLEWGGQLGARVFGYPLRHLHRLRLI